MSNGGCGRSSKSSYVFHTEALSDLAAVMCFIRRLWGSSSNWVYHIEALEDLAAIGYITLRLWKILQQLCVSNGCSGRCCSSYVFHMEVLIDLAAAIYFTSRLLGT